QRQLAAEIGTSWSEFALVSPDIWRKQLLDYSTLGPAFKYAGPFTGDELRIVDQKLDRYIARKAEGGRMTHLLIDRFRFDSFAPDSEVAGSNLLTRFGKIVYLFFMITPPGELVERAWRRGLDVVRYRRVDVNAKSPDTLFRDRGLLAPEKNLAFLTECVARFREVIFADSATGCAYLRLRSGVPVWRDPERLQRGANAPDAHAGLHGVAARAFDPAFRWGRPSRRTPSG
ncbi:MAG: hypothetical protein ACXWUS_16115, partial [Burkholderiales bacterium]